MDHPLNATNRAVVAAAERAYAEGGMAKALRVAVQEAGKQARAQYGDDPGREAVHASNILYCEGSLVPVN